jgi:hypothetical protein
VHSPLSLEETRTQIADYIRYYNEERLHSAIGYVAPKDKLDAGTSRFAQSEIKNLKRPERPESKSGWRKNVAPPSTIQCRHLGAPLTH